MLNGLGHFAGQTPGARLGIRLSLRSVRSSQRRDFKLWMMFEQLDKALTDDASCSQNSYAKFVCHMNNFSDDEVSTICVSRWVLHASIVASLTHPLTRVVLTSIKPRSYFNEFSAIPRRRTPSLNLSSSAQNEIRR